MGINLDCSNYVKQFLFVLWFTSFHFRAGETRCLVSTPKSRRWFWRLGIWNCCPVNGEWLASLGFLVRGSSSCNWCSDPNSTSSSGRRAGDSGVMSNFSSAVVGEVTGCLGAAASSSTGYGWPAALVSSSHTPGDRRPAGVCRWDFWARDLHVNINIPSPRLRVWSIVSLGIQLAYWLNSYFILEGQHDTLFHDHKIFIRITSTVAFYDNPSFLDFGGY